MNVYKLLLGALFVVGSILFFIYTVKSNSKDENYGASKLSYDFQIILGTIAVFIVGAIMIYREIFG